MICSKIKILAQPASAFDDFRTAAKQQGFHLDHRLGISPRTVGIQRPPYHLPCRPLRRCVDNWTRALPQISDEPVDPLTAMVPWNSVDGRQNMQVLSRL
jgi:hypothetical protein